jgi:hypothetical protein
MDGGMIAFFKFSLFDYVQIKLNGFKGYIEACKVDVNGIKSYRINDKWWIEAFLEKPPKRFSKEQTQ